MEKAVTVAGIEIGTTKTVVVVGEIVNNHSLSITGFAESPSLGVKKGEVMDFESASVTVHGVIAAAEESAGGAIEEVYVAQTGGHLEGFYNEGFVNVSSSSNRVMQEDIDRAIQEAKSKQLEEGRVYIHHIQNPFAVDGRQVANPLGLEGRRLSVGYWSVHGDVRKIRDPIHIINGFGLRVNDMIISSVATGSVVASETEKQNGVVVVDIGGGTTDYAVYRGGYVIKTGVIPVGGDHITNDLSLGLRLEWDQAEELKIRLGEAGFLANEGGEYLSISGQVERFVLRESVISIISARVAELFELLKEVVSEVVTLDELSAGVILTGGTSRLGAIEEVASRVFGLYARRGGNPSWAQQQLQDAEYSTVLGLLHFALKRKEKDGGVVLKRSGFLSRVAKVLNL